MKIVSEIHYLVDGFQLEAGIPAEVTDKALISKMLSLPGITKVTEKKAVSELLGSEEPITASSVKE